MKKLLLATSIGLSMAGCSNFIVGGFPPSKNELNQKFEKQCANAGLVKGDEKFSECTQKEYSNYLIGANQKALVEVNGAPKPAK